MVTVIAALTVLVIDTLTPVGLAVWLLQVILVWVTTFWAGRREVIAITSVCSACAVAGFWLSPWIAPVTWVDQTNLLMGLGVMMALSYTCVRRLAAEDARRKAAEDLAKSEETVRILRGLLPICAWCKKIRNEGGNWEQLEVYIGSHSQAKFTHGMCPECAAGMSSHLK